MSEQRVNDVPAPGRTTFADIWRSLQQRERREDHAPPVIDADATLDLIHQDLSLLIGIAQQQWRMERQIWQPFFVPVGTTQGGIAYPLIKAPALQRLQFQNVVMSTIGAGDTVAGLNMTGEGMPVNAPAPLSQAGQWLCFFYMKQQFSWFPVPSFELPAGATLNIITPQAGTTNSLFVFGNYRILDNLGEELSYGRRA